MPVAPCIVNDVSNVMRIQYLVRLQGDACRSVHCK